MSNQTNRNRVTAGKTRNKFYDDPPIGGPINRKVVVIAFLLFAAGILSILFGIVTQWPGDGPTLAGLMLTLAASTLALVALHI